MNQNVKRKIVLIISCVYMVIIFTPITAHASLNCKKWEVSCWDVGKTKTVQVNGSKDGKYKAELNDSDGSYDRWFPIKWSSDNKDIATVDKNGKITIVAKKSGTATITARFTIVPRAIYDRGMTRELGTCKITVRHEYRTIDREATFWKAGGKLGICKCGKERFKKKQNFVYTEEFVKKQMKKIVESCPFTTSWFDENGKLQHQRGYQTPDDYFEWLVENKKYPKSILEKKTTVTRNGTYRGKIGQDSSEAGCHVFEVLLSGYQDYKCIYSRFGDDANFDFETDLKAGDLLVIGDEYSIFKEYQYDGEDVRMNVYDLDHGTFFEDVYYVSDVDVYRLSNYK